MKGNKAVLMKFLSTQAQKLAGEDNVFVDKSSIEGQGLFAGKGFKKGEVIGLAHQQEQPVGLTGNFHNHSPSPNAVSVKQGSSRFLVAAKNLPAGAEITSDYRMQPELEQPSANWMQRGGQTNNDREMVEGIADILTMVKDPVNRRQIAAEMVRDFKREGVKYDLQEFQKMAQVRMQRGGLTFQQYYTPAAESTGANYTPIMTVQTAEKLKAQRDAQELVRRRQAIQASQAAASKPLRERLTPENLAQETGATGDKLRFFPNDPDSFIDDYLNPLKMVGDMASGLGRIPLNVKQGNYGAAALDVAIPVATGALAGLGAKSAGQFVNNLANPLAGTGQFLTTKTPLKNAYNLLPEGSFSGYSKLRNADKSYRVAGMDAYDDFVESGVLRSNAPNPPAGASLEERVMLSRPTGFPSFQKGFADLRYLPDNGGVVFETSLPTFKRGEINPVTGQRIKGRHYAHRVIDPNTGATMSNIPGENISVYEGAPHWLKGYRQIDTPKQLPGAGDLAANAAAKSSTFGQIKSGLQDLGHIYDQSLGYLFNNRANKRAIAEGNEWLRNWIQHPATQAKIDNDFADKINRSFVKDVYDLGYEQAKNFTPVSTELPLSVQLARGFYPNKDNWGVSYLHGVDPMPRRMIEQGQMDAPLWHGSFISRTLDLPYKKRVGTTIHEGTHDWTSRFGLEASGQREFLERSINPEIHQELEYWRRQGDDKTRADLGKERRYQAYLADPTEQHARIMELRKYLGHTPDFVSTPEYAQKVMNHLSAMPRHKRPIDSEGFFKVFDNDPQKLSNMFNRLWGVTPVAVAGVAAASEKKDGGQHGGLDRWFAEKWVDIKTGKECGRQEGEKRAGYPACRPSKRVSEDTPKTASELSSSEKEKFKRSKTSSERISYQHKRKQDGGEWLDKYENTKKNRQKVDQLFGPPAAGNVDYVPAVESVVGGFSAGLAKSALAPVVKSNLQSLQKYMEMQDSPFAKIDLPVFNEAKNWLDNYTD